MTDDLKSAWELAQERMARGADVKKLTDEQKLAIAAVRQEFKAKRAEAELAHNDALKKLRQRGEFEQLEKLAEEYARERKALDDQEEARVQTLREA